MILVRRIAIFLVAASLLIQSAPACTIFVLADESRALFFNNEDYSNPNTRIWFSPGGKNFYGAVYIGFDDGWAQGGMNEAGLAYDWVAGFNDEWKRTRTMKSVRGNPSQRMLETCSTIDDAIAFYQRHWEPGLWRARTLIADRTGASIIVSAENGKLKIDRASGSRGFGYAGVIANRMLAQKPSVAEQSGIQILNACSQQGEFATKYSNVFDLRARKIAIYRPDQAEAAATFDLAAELKKGGSFYDIPQIETQLTQSERPLPPVLRRFAVDEWKPLPHQDTRLNGLVRRLLRESANGQMRASDYSEDLWKHLSPDSDKVKADLQKLGRLKRVTEVERSEKDGMHRSLFRVEFAKAIVIQSFDFDPNRRVAGSKNIAAEIALE